MSPERLTPTTLLKDGEIVPVDDAPEEEDLAIIDDVIEEQVIEAEVAKAEEAEKDPYEAFWNIYDAKDAANRLSTFEARREAIAEAQRRGVDVPPDLL